MNTVVKVISCEHRKQCSNLSIFFLQFGSPRSIKNYYLCFFWCQVIKMRLKWFAFIPVVMVFLMDINVSGSPQSKFFGIFQISPAKLRFTGHFAHHHRTTFECITRYPKWPIKNVFFEHIQRYTVKSSEEPYFQYDKCSLVLGAHSYQACWSIGVSLRRHTRIPRAVRGEAAVSLLN